MRHIKPVQIYLGKYSVSDEKEDSGEEKILKYAESLYGTKKLNTKQKLEILRKLESLYDKDLIKKVLK